MEFRADLVDGISGPAAAGAAAVKAEAAALRDLAAATTAAERKGGELPRADPTVGAAAPKRGRGRPRKSKEAPAEDSTTGALPAVAKKGFIEGHEDAGGESPWAKWATGAGDAAKASKGVGDATLKAGDAGAKGAKGTELGLSRVTGAAGGAIAAMVGVAAASAGIGGLGDLTKLAIGWRGMAQLQTISMRATMDTRRLFQGLDSSPLVRAAFNLEKNLSQSTVTGKALSGVLQRGFSGAFAVAERLEPVLSGAFQLGVLGALQLEGALLRTEIAAAPLIVAFEDFAESEAGAAVSAGAVSAAISTIGGVVAIATIPLRDMIKQLQLLSAFKKVWDSDGKDVAGVAKALGLAAPTTAAGAPAPAGGSKPQADGSARTSGHATGKDLGAGIVAGMADQEAAVRAGGGRLADAANQGARTKAEAHSPSEMTKRLGRDLGDGSIVGMDSKRDEVQAAAERSLVPDVSGGRGGGAAVTASASPTAGPASVTLHFYFPALTSGRPDDIKAAASEFHAGVRTLAMQLGLPVPVIR